MASILEKLQGTIPTSNLPLTALAAVGTLTVAYKALAILSFTRLHLLHRSTLPQYLSTDPRNPSWALVTGASDGIGKGVATELAARGFNVILHGRNPTKLGNVVANLQQQFPARQFSTIIIDAADSAGMAAAVDAAVAHVRSLTGGLRVLVNNVGGTSFLKNPMSSLEEHTADIATAVIDVNARLSVLLTHALLPTLRAQPSALVLNCGSIAGMWPGAYITVYCGTKAFIKAWGVAMGKELRLEGSKVEVLNIIIGQVNETAGLPDAATLLAPSGKTMAKSMLSKVGCGRESVVAHWSHAVLVEVLELLPSSVLDGFMADTSKMLRAKFMKGR